MINSQYQQLIAMPNTHVERRLDHRFYRFVCGKIRDDDKKYLTSIEDHHSEICLRNVSWVEEKGYMKYFSEKNLETFYVSEVTFGELTNITKNISFDPINKLLACAHRSARLWEQYNVSGEDALKLSLALAVYTGSESETLNMNCNMQLKEFFLNQERNFADRNCRVLNGYLIKALSHLPFYLGMCMRCVELSIEDINEYEPGKIITWLQFSSATISLQPLNFCKNRNTRFIIFSVKGRDISKFSLLESEKEILFLPYSHFLVYWKEKKSSITYVYLRQIDLGISTMNILWVDDRIFDPNWENKLHMERANQMNPRIKFIPKISTRCALAYLSSIWGNRQKQKRDCRFRIISDLNRPGEPDPENAGAIFISEVLKLEFTCPIMLFTSSVPRGRAALQSKNVNPDKVIVTSSPSEALLFLQFTDNRN